MKNQKFNFKMKLAALSLLVAVAINFGLVAQDQSVAGGTSCADSCETDDFRVCSIAAKDINGHEITVLCHYMTKK
ncbi:hypothetical protein M3O96_16400 [Aquiflexum sp. TKW24L]|uniref:hypothetical protein n=1 Tax=Aquiflexum sp. TKW24L TaxID=2942212 RepID=UPI0020BEBB98|nr:hypothetical protein [Aquiflexum sp. TKW24L]MCL6260687.1 hypothetical protein [Aquiflexum sp. TKW24L]